MLRVPLLTEINVQTTQINTATDVLLVFSPQMQVCLGQQAASLTPQTAV